MWPRVVEFMLACWLAVSQFIFAYPPEHTVERASDLVCATLIAAFALVSHVRRWRATHLLTLAVAGWLVVLVFLRAGSFPPAPEYQNHLILALLLAMIAIIPSRSDEPPHAWQLYYGEPDAVE